MQGIDGNSGEHDVVKSVDHPPKIALVPFVQANPPVHLLDSDGKASSARERSAEDDFQLAVQSLGTGHTASADKSDSDDDDDGDEDDIDDDDDDDDLEAELNASDGGLTEADGDGERLSKGAGNAEEGKAHSGNGLEKEEEEKSGATTRKSPSPAEHPLQKAVTSFDMALGELNQLVHLVDLARAGEFMVLERVTPSDEEQARATLDQSASVPRESLPTMVKLKKRQLKGAAEQLRTRAKRLRETMEVQLAFQEGVLHLRKSWRIVAPNHGKVNVPLQVGEALSVDCSFGSAGGRPVPSTAAAGTRHRHPWLFQLRCGDRGRLEAQPSNAQCFKALEVQLVSVATGVCDYSLRASFPGKGDECDRTAAPEEQVRQPRQASSDVGVPGRGRHGDGDDQMEHLEQHILRLQHSVFWEETFETLKAEALIDGKDGWRVHQDTRCNSDLAGRIAVAGSSESAGRVESGAKRRLIGVDPREMPTSAWNAEARVVHVLDDEVMVEMDNQYLLGYRLVPGGKVTSDSRGGHPASSACGGRTTSDGKGGYLESGRRQSASLCKLALLYCATLIRQQQLVKPAARQAAGSQGDTGRQVGAWIPADSGGNKASVEESTAASTWKSVGRILSHHMFRSEIVQGLDTVSRSLRRIGLPLVVRWTHLEETYPTSALSITLGHCFHFRASLGNGGRIVVSALPGLQNDADQRNVEMQSVQDFKHFLLGEVCRQIVLTFGDIAAAWTNEPEGTKCFRVDLMPAAIHLSPRLKARSAGLSSPREGCGSSCEVRVFVEEVEVIIACSSWSPSSYTPNGRSPVKQDHTGILGSSSAWNSALGSTAAPAPEVKASEWDRLDGRDLFQKFSSLLDVLYPCTTSSTDGS